MTDVDRRGVVYSDEPSAVNQHVVARRAPWSPMQLVGLIVGVALIVIGGVALARSGMNFSHVEASRSQVAGLGFTSMSALIVTIVGVFIAIGCSSPYSARSVMWTFGIIMFAFGLIVALTPDTFYRMWGFTTANGDALAVCGGVLVLAVALSPIFVHTRRSVVWRDRRP